MSYEQQVINDFKTSYKIALVKKRRHRKSMSKDEFYHFNLVFAKRYDAKWMTRFSDYVVKDFPDDRQVVAFDFEGGKILD